MDMQFKSEMLNVCPDAVPTPPSPDPPRHHVPPPEDVPEPPIRPMRRKYKMNGSRERNTPQMNNDDEKNSNTLAPMNVINIIKSQGIHFGPEIVYNIGARDKSSKADDVKSEPKINRTRKINELLDSKIKITHEYMDVISKQIGEGWRSVFRKMGFEDGEIELVYESNQHKGVSEVIYQLLLNWTRADNRTLGELCTILWNEEKYSLVQNLATLDASTKENL